MELIPDFLATKPCVAQSPDNDDVTPDDIASAAESFVTFDVYKLVNSLSFKSFNRRAFDVVFNYNSTNNEFLQPTDHAPANLAVADIHPL
jgi:hypothetical protein